MARGETKVVGGKMYTRVSTSMGNSRQRLNNNFFEGDYAGGGANGDDMGNVDSAYSGSPNVAVRQMRFSMRVCGPKLSLCGVVLSVWGILQLTCMWLAFNMRSVAFIEDIMLNETLAGESVRSYAQEVERAYDMGANNCKIAALLYVVTLLVSLHQRWLNGRTQPQSYQRYA